MRSSTRFVGFVVAVALLPLAVQAGFTSHTLQLRQGDVPLLDAAPMAASAYGGFVDAYVDSDNAASTFFAEPTVRFGAKPGASGSPTGATTRGYLRFDDFASYVPADAVITSAKLTLTSAGPNLVGAYNSYLRYRTTTFNGITFSGAGAKFDNTVGMTTIGGWDGQWAANNVQTVDITALARQWQSGTIANNGLQFVGVEDSYWSGMGQQFYSSEYATDTSKRPTLQIQYVTPGLVPPFTAPARRQVQTLSGAGIISDTWVSSTSASTAKGAVATGYIQEWSDGDHVLMKVNSSSLAGLAKTGDATVDGTVRLVSASLQLGMNPDFRTPSLSLWKANAAWSDAAATWNTTDGSIAWSPAWVNSQMAGGPIISPKVTSTAFSNLVGSPSISFDITALLQSYIDGGATNYGFVLGGSGAAWEIGAQEAIYLTEYGTDWLRPTLVIETLQMLPEPGSLLLLLAGACFAGARRGRHPHVGCLRPERPR